MEKSAGTQFAETARRYFHIGPRTRSFRSGINRRREIAETITFASTLPGYFSKTTEDAFRPAFAALCSHQKHIDGFRADPVVCGKFSSMTPYQFINALRDMIDAGVTNVGEGEVYFQQLS